MIVRELKEGVLVLTLDRPKANAFTTAMAVELQNALKDAKRDKAVRSILLQANGKLFSAGQDVTEFGADGHVSFRKHLHKTYNPLVLQMRQLEKPILAAIQGAAAGAALGLALACDIRIGSPDARFVIGFSGIGLAPDSAVSLMLPAIIGLGRASQAAFYNEPISAEQALAWGLLNAVVPADALPQSAWEWALRLAQGPTNAMGLTKRAFNKALLANLEDVLDYEAHNQEVAGEGSDHKEGLAAFVEKRAPDYAKAAGH
jgi:2-(1,2-epoxy-1,2-dihydrophenyl)acetyl-CoA isomerase